MSTIVHFDISVNDMERAKKFYEGMFNWKIEKFPNDFMEYCYIETQNANGEKGINGGMGKREKDWQHITNYVQVNSIDEAIEKVKRLGGKVIEPKMEVPTVGFIATCYDTEDNVFGLIEEIKP